MHEFDQPALFKNADLSAAKHQRKYLFLLVAQYGLLIMASLAALSDRFFGAQNAILIYVGLLVLATNLQIFFAATKPEKNWYAARALAESIRSISWRYVMRADPFTAKKSDDTFYEALDAVLEPHRETGMFLSTGLSHGDQISSAMTQIRSSSLSNRKKIYSEQRIDFQLNWYRSKTILNRDRGRILSAILIGIYISAFALAAIQYLNIGLSLDWYSEPVLVCAASLLGWIQAKRYSELTASYNLTAHDVAKIQNKIRGVRSEKQFSEFVVEAESGFSREHTQWVARQNTPPN